MSTRLLLPLAVSLVLAGCVSQEEPTALHQVLVGGPSAADDADVETRRNLVLTVSTLIPGDAFTITVTGANANEQIQVARSLAGAGVGPCFGTASLLCLDVVSPSLQGSIVADAQGEGRLTQTLPASVPIGSEVTFQAVVPRGASGAAWIKSAAVPVVIEDAALTVGDLVAGDLVITEVMMNPVAVADADGEWFEVYNATELDMNLGGLEVTDFQGDRFVVPGSVFLPAGEVVVFGPNADLATNGGVEVDVVTTDVTLANGFDELHLLAGATIVDTVAWDDGQSFPDPVGASMELHWDVPDALSNDAGENWVAATTAYGDGDLGTPGVGPQGMGRWLYTVDQDADELRRVDLDTLTWETIGTLGTDFAFGDLAYDQDGRTLYMVDGRGSEGLWTVDLRTGAASLVGVHGVPDMFGLAWDPRTDTLYGVVENGLEQGLHELDRTTGAATFVGAVGTPGMHALTYDGERGYLVGFVAGYSDLYGVDPGTLTSNLIYDAPAAVGSCGFAHDGVTDTFWALDASGDLYSYDPALGYAQTLVDSQAESYDGLAWVPYAR